MVLCPWHIHSVAVICLAEFLPSVWQIRSIMPSCCDEQHLFSLLCLWLIGIAPRAADTAAAGRVFGELCDLGTFARVCNSVLVSSGDVCFCPVSKLKDWLKNYLTIFDYKVLMDKCGQYLHIFYSSSICYLQIGEAWWNSSNLFLSLFVWLLSDIQVPIYRWYL